MDVMTHEPQTEETKRRGVADRLLVPEFWAAVTIVTMWLAVLFVGIFGGDMVFHDVSGSGSMIPSAVAVALFAAIGTSAVAKRVFGRRTRD
jgi:4-amino-4-deoxy-L-arabinose transferase-like glycosyltransferase